MRARLDDTIDISAHPALFGTRREPGLVNVSADRRGVLTAYHRRGEELHSEEVEFRPFLWISERDVLRGFEGDLETKRLDGDNVYRYLVQASDWSQIKALSDHIAKVSGLYPSHPDSPQLFLTDPLTQYLLATGQTYYNRMAIEEVHTLHMRVYTAGDLSSRPGDDPQRIVAVGLREGVDGKCHLIDDADEDKLLWHLTGKIKKIDPDLITGHNLYKHDLQLISERAKIHRVKLDWGRAGGRLTGQRSRTVAAEKKLDYKRFNVDGRELADSWILSVIHDITGRELVGYDLEDVAAHFAIEIADPKDDLLERAQKDTAGIALLHRHLSYPYFLQSQIFPLTYENVMLRGNATRINLIFLREYYRQGHSIPSKPEVVPFAGGLTAQEHQGLAYGVYHCDVASLYPSLIITYGLGPSGDTLEIFTDLLETLRDYRLLTKAQEREASTAEGAAFYGNLQTTFKILINSFYGYLGFGQGNFADFDRAAEVTARGRELLQKMMGWLKERNAQILEVDTDGIYFVPSEKFAKADWIEELNNELPEGVEVEFDGRYIGMYCHKMKNYALLDEHQNLILRGSGLRSRALEPFLRQFIEDLIRACLTGGVGAHETVFEEYQERFKEGDFSVQEVAKTDNLIDSPATYARKIDQGGRNRAAVYELALASEHDYRAGDSISYYVTGTKASVTVYNNCRKVEDYDPDEPDINFKYYLRKLKQTFKNFDRYLVLPEVRSPIAFEDLPRPTH